MGFNFNALKLIGVSSSKAATFGLGAIQVSVSPLWDIVFIFVKILFLVLMEEVLL